LTASVLEHALEPATAGSSATLGGDSVAIGFRDPGFASLDDPPMAAVERIRDLTQPTFARGLPSDVASEYGGRLVAGSL